MLTGGLRRRRHGGGAALGLRRSRGDRQALFRHAAGRRHRAGTADHGRPGAGAASARDRGAARRRNWRGYRRSGRRAPTSRFCPMIDPARHIAGFRAYLDRHPQPRPVLEWAIRWLETHIPEPLPPVLCHRDFRTGNYMLDRRRADRRSSIGNSPAGAIRTRISAGSAARAGASRGSIARRAASPSARRFIGLTRRRRGVVSIPSGCGSGKCWRMSAGPSSRCSRATAI